MRDRLRFAVPFGAMGWIAEALVLRQYLERFLEERNKAIQSVAEDVDAWNYYLDE